MPYPFAQAVAWHCQHVEVVDINTGETWLFPCNAWLGGPSASLPATAAAASAQIKPEQSKLLLPTPSLDGLFKQLQEEQEEEQKEQYKVAVYTSAQSPAQGKALATISAYNICRCPQTFVLGGALATPVPDTACGGLAGWGHAAHGASTLSSCDSGNSTC